MVHRFAGVRALRLTALSLLALGAAAVPAFSTTANAAGAGGPTYGERTISVSMDIEGVPHTGVFQLVTSSDDETNLDQTLADFAARFPDASVVEVAAGGSVSAQAVIKPYRWPNGTANWGYNAAAAPAGLTGEIVAFEAAALTWNSSGVDFVYESVGATAANTGACSGSGLDGHNTIGWRDQTDNILAVTCTWYAGATEPKDSVEFDMEFDPDWDWTTATPIGFDLQSIATHELGHALGLGHSPVKDAVMYKSYAEGANKRALNADDIDGATQIYGAADPSTQPLADTPAAPDQGGGTDGTDGGSQGPSFPTPPLAFSIPSGSNLMTWPYAATSVAALTLTGTDTVYGYDAVSGSWLRYSPAFPPSTNTLNTLEQGFAYWFMTSSTLEVSAAQLGY